MAGVRETGDINRERSYGDLTCGFIVGGIVRIVGIVILIGTLWFAKHVEGVRR